MSVNWQEIIFTFLGGLGMFLFSIKFMGDGLQQIAGDKLRYYIDKYTSNPFLGVLVGIGFTALIQSSTGVTVITVGLVSAGLLTLRQAIGIVMGANIGTTVTSFLIGFKLGDYALPIIFVGAMCLFFTKKRSINNIGRILFGVGGIFFALKLMSQGMAPLQQVPAFKETMLSLSANPIYGVAAGAILTVIIQSSAATIGILQSLYASGLMDLHAALPVLFGDNIGTTLTAVIAALSANISAKRVAASHVMFNVLGTVICLILLSPFTSLIQWFQMKLSLSPEMTIAFAHGTFNITNTIIQFPFIGFLAYIVTKVVPGEDEIVKYGTVYLDKEMIKQSSSIAVGQAKKELLHMGGYALEALEISYRYMTERKIKIAEKGRKFENAVNHLDEALTEYLIDLSRESLSQKESEILTNLLDSSRDVERIGDHAEDLLNLTDYQLEKNIVFSSTALKELNEMYELTTDMLKRSLVAVENNDIELANELMTQHHQIRKLERTLRKTHIKRLNNGECTAQAGVNFVDMIGHYTRIADHAQNLIEKVIVNQI